MIPVPGSTPTVLLDSGANAECTAAWLLQFAQMGAAYAVQRLGKPEPLVALLSIGEESSKGNDLVREAHALLAEPGALRTGRFVGNVEGRDMLTDAADVVVADGFTGNIALKVLEGTSRVVRDAIRGAITSNPVSSAGGLLIRRPVNRLRDSLDPENVGGAILLGLRKPVVVGHGSFGPKGIAGAVALARRAVDEDMVGRTHAALEAAGALRSAPAGSFASVKPETPGTPG